MNFKYNYKDVTEKEEKMRKNKNKPGWDTNCTRERGN